MLFLDPCLISQVIMEKIAFRYAGRLTQYIISLHWVSGAPKPISSSRCSSSMDRHFSPGHPTHCRFITNLEYPAKTPYCQRCVRWSDCWGDWFGIYGDLAALTKSDFKQVEWICCRCLPLLCGGSQHHVSYCWVSEMDPIVPIALGGLIGILQWFAATA